MAGRFVVKTLAFEHIVRNARNGLPVARTENLAVFIDTQTRRAMDIQDDVRKAQDVLMARRAGETV